MTVRRNPEVLDWLMAGDPAIQWQTMRDLLDAPEAEWQDRRRRVGADDDWAGRFLARQDPTGTWGGGIYSPKWVSTTYTLLTLLDCGITADCGPAVRGAQIVLDSLATTPRDSPRGLGCLDLCVAGFYVRIGASLTPAHQRLPELIEYILERQLPDGGWNCRCRIKRVKHGSFHTTFNVLDGLKAATEAGLLDAKTFAAYRDRALEFMLLHALYRSDKTGEVINPKFTMFSDPVRWHYDVLRGLDFMRPYPQILDPRAGDPLELVISKQRSSGKWSAQNRHGGLVFFHMEGTCPDSRWVTLRALRVLRAAGRLST